MALTLRGFAHPNESKGLKGSLPISAPVTGAKQATTESAPSALNSPALQADPLPLTTLSSLRALVRDQGGNTTSILNPLRFGVPFIGRQAQLAELRRWFEEGPRVSFKLVAGPGGRGKTRIAVRLLEEIDRLAPGKWHAAFLNPALCEEHLTIAKLRQPQAKPALIVIEDASKHADLLAKHVISEIPNIPTTWRFLLIDRGCNENSRWYRNLITAAGTDFSGLFSEMELPALSSTPYLDRNERRSLLDAALERLHEIDGRPRLTPDEQTEENLGKPVMGDPLVILMAAIVSHDRRDLSPLSYRRIDLADLVAGQEERRIALLADPGPSFLPLHMVAYITLLRRHKDQRTKGDLSGRERCRRA
jgi:hypothetical protein